MEIDMIDGVLNQAEASIGKAVEVIYEFEDHDSSVPNHRAIFVTIFAAFFAVFLSKSKFPHFILLVCSHRTYGLSNG